MFTVLRTRSYARLWLSSLISTLGDWLLLVALPLSVLTLSGSALATGLTLLSATLPTVLFAPLAGALADRWDRRRLMIACDLSRAALLPMLLLVHDTRHLWIVYTVTFLMSMVRKLFDPASRAMVPQLLDGSRLVRAGALLSIAGDAARLVGPALGGVLYAASGLRLVVWLDVLSFLCSALLIAGVRVSSPKEAVPAPHGSEDGRLGWRRVWRSPALRVLLLADVLSSVKEGSYNVLGVVSIAEVLARHVRAGGLRLRPALLPVLPQHPELTLQHGAGVLRRLRPDQGLEDVGHRCGTAGRDGAALRRRRRFSGGLDRNP
jgi:MFS family permease